MHRGLDRAKHFVEDAYDQATGQPQQSWLSSLFSGSKPVSRGLGSRVKEYGQKIGDAFSGRRHNNGGFFGGGHDSRFLHFEEPSAFQNFLYWFEDQFLTSPLLFVAYPLFLGLFISSWAHKQVRSHGNFYERMSIPRSMPPSWLYDPMWTMVLTAMGYASWLVFEEDGFDSWIALGLYNLCVLGLVTWPVLFFTLNDHLWAPLLASGLSCCMLLTNALFFFHSFAAGTLFLPASFWVCYMTVINWQIYSANPGTTRAHAAKERGESTMELRETRKVR